MMKRFAAHYVYMPGRGFLKRFVVETWEEGVVRLFPLTGEVENTEWLPGVIVLLPEGMPLEGVVFDVPVLLEAAPADAQASLSACAPYLFYPFDFTGKKPVAGTRRTRLR